MTEDHPTVQRTSPHQVTIHYRRTLGDYEGWGLHAWGPIKDRVSWDHPLPPVEKDEYGITWVVNLHPGADVLYYIVHRGHHKDPGPDQVLALDLAGREIWLIQGSDRQFADPEHARQALLQASLGNFHQSARAHWLTPAHLVWPLEYDERGQYELHVHPEGGLQVADHGLCGGQSIQLEYEGRGLPADLTERFPHLSDGLLLRLPESQRAQVPRLLKGQCVLSLSDQAGSPLVATGVQIAGVLDALYPYAGPLGPVFNEGSPSLFLWAPTASSVSVLLYDGSERHESPMQQVPMTFEASSGIWFVEGEASWYGKYYLYEVQVYVRRVGRIVKNQVVDPYATSLSTNGGRSHIIDLADPATKPEGWDAFQKSAPTDPTDIVLYELHVRDFSSRDENVPAHIRGGYLAFSQQGGAGRRHLERLAAAGLTHVHLLPVVDFATVDEDRSTWREPDFAVLAQLPPDSEEQQAILSVLVDRDGYNWGYDPYHFMVPEGSYATKPDGASRILEFRQMILALGEMGLRVVMDVVFNHTYSAGQAPTSILDRIVPDYYYRLDEEGRITSSTCCANTASEHTMMEKLMLDSLIRWATAYKIDGFRFDLMGHHMRRNLVKARQVVDRLTRGEAGVDGQGIYLYGEGWDFGEVAGNQRGITANQFNMAGTGIGTFNDRMRDSARGGGPFTGIQAQGFVSGLLVDPNDSPQGSTHHQRSLLLEQTDLIRLSLAGNLADFRFVNRHGSLVRGADIDYQGQPAGYARQPQENVVYLSAHDNETLFDALQLKLPHATNMQDRVRAQNLGISLLALSQGVPFFHAGVELLRSKSLDRDSYNSGDWFNYLDYSYRGNNWGVGLPPADKNRVHWPLMRLLLGRPDLKPGEGHIQACLTHFEEMLRIRRSSPLFRLRAAEDVIERIRFHNTGPAQQPGLIVMSIDGRPQPVLDQHNRAMLVFFNAAPWQISFELEELSPLTFNLHPIQQQSADPIVGTSAFDVSTRTFTVPGRTAAVFVAAAKESRPV